MTRNSSNNQVRVRVNAWVDEAIAPLVEALNDFPDLLTFDSCLDRRGDVAWVTFSHRSEAPNETLAFIQFLASELQLRMDSESGCRVGLEWNLGGEQSVARIESPKDKIFALAEVLHDLASAEVAR